MVVAMTNLEQLAARYYADGFYILPDVFSPAECNVLKAEAARVMKKHAKPQATVYVGVSVVSPIYEKLAEKPRLVEVLKAIMPGGIMFLSDKFVVKTATQRFATPWHIDAAYWPSTRPKLSVWIPLDDSSERNGTLMIVRGSHRKTFVHEQTAGEKTNGEFNNIIASKHWPKEDEIICNVSRGTAIFFSDRLVHGSCASTSGDERCAIINTYHAPAADDEFDKHFPARRVIVAS